MNYFVKQGEQKLGPYTLAELYQQVTSGKVAATDLAQSEGMTGWAPVSQVLGSVPIPAATPAGAAAASQQAAPARTVPLPFNLHWAILLVLDLVSRNFFNFVWAFYLANWARKLDGQTKPLVLVAMYPGGIIAGIVAMANEHIVIGTILIVAGAIAYIVGIFEIRSEMETYYNSTERYGLTLSAVMTFFFSTVYLQYHINQISKWKKAAGVPS